MGRRNRITQVRNEIARSIDRLAYRTRINSCDEEVLERFGVSIQVEYDVMDDFYRRVEIIDLSVSDGERKDYPNIAKMVGDRLGWRLKGMNEENENDFLDSLSLPEKKEIFDWIS